MKPKPHLSPTEFARLHNVNRSTVYAWIKRGLPHRTRTVEVIEIPPDATPPPANKPGPKPKTPPA